MLSARCVVCASLILIFELPLACRVFDQTSLQMVGQNVILLGKWPMADHYCFINAGLRTWTNVTR